MKITRENKLNHHLWNSISTVKLVPPGMMGSNNFSCTLGALLSVEQVSALCMINTSVDQLIFGTHDVDSI